MIYSLPDERPSAKDILDNKCDWSFEDNAEVNDQMNRIRIDESQSLLKFLKYRFISKIQENDCKISDINLTEIIGHGGYGRVFKVFFKQEHYAIKKIMTDHLKRNYLDKNSEIQIMTQLKNDFIVNLYDYWIDEDFEFPLHSNGIM